MGTKTQSTGYSRSLLVMFGAVMGGWCRSRSSDSGTGLQLGWRVKPPQRKPNHQPVKGINHATVRRRENTLPQAGLAPSLTIWPSQCPTPHPYSHSSDFQGDFLPEVEVL